MPKFYSVLSFLFCINNFLFGQSQNFAEDYRASTLGKYPGLVSGAVYPEKEDVLRDDPSLYEKGFFSSKLEYEGFHFEGEKVMYDVFLDQIVLSREESQKPIILNADLVSYVEFSDGTRLVKKDANTSYKHHRNGYYRLVYSGERELLAKHRKSIQTFSSPSDYYKFFSKNLDYFILEDDAWILVDSPNQLIKLLNVDNKEFKRHLKSLNLNYKRDTDKYLIELLRYSETNQSAL